MTQNGNQGCRAFIREQTRERGQDSVQVPERRTLVTGDWRIDHVRVQFDGYEANVYTELAKHVSDCSKGMTIGSRLRAQASLLVTIKIRRSDKDTEVIVEAIYSPKDLERIGGKQVGCSAKSAFTQNLADPMLKGTITPFGRIAGDFEIPSARSGMEHNHRFFL